MMAKVRRSIGPLVLAFFLLWCNPALQAQATNPPEEDQKGPGGVMVHRFVSTRVFVVKKPLSPDVQELLKTTTAISQTNSEFLRKLLVVESLDVARTRELQAQAVKLVILTSKLPGAVPLEQLNIPNVQIKKKRNFVMRWFHRDEQ